MKPWSLFLLGSAAVMALAFLLDFVGGMGMSLRHVLPLAPYGSWVLFCAARAWRNGEGARRMVAPAAMLAVGAAWAFAADLLMVLCLRFGWFLPS